MKPTAFRPLVLLLCPCLAVSLLSARADAPPDIAHLQQAASSGDSQAEFQLGKAFYTGTGVRKDPAQAAPWYLKAAEKGDAEAQYRLAVLYVKGEGVERSVPQTYFWLTFSARGGNLLARRDLATIRASDRYADDVAAGEQLLAGYNAQHPPGSPAPDSTPGPAPKN